MNSKTVQSYLFLDYYKTLEQTIINKYNLKNNTSPISYILNMKAYRDYKEELNYCKEVRNFLSHEPKIDKEFGIIPSTEMIELIKKLIGMVSEAPKVNVIMKSIDDLFYAKEDDYVLPKLKTLSHRLYTHIPIIKDKKVIGVLSKDSIFNYLLDNGFERISEEKRFLDFKEYTKLDSSYIFIKKDITIDEVIIDVEEHLKRGDRISYIFVTHDGKSSSELCGLFTPLDLLRF